MHREKFSYIFQVGRLEKVPILSMLEQPRTYPTYKRKSTYFLQSVLSVSPMDNYKGRNDSHN